MKKFLSFIKAYPLIVVVLGVIIAGIILLLVGRGEWAGYLLAGFSLLIAVRLLIGMVRDLRSGRYGIDILAIAAIISTILVGEYWASIVIVLMLTGGEALEDYAANRARRELDALLKRAPRTAHLIKGDEVKTVPLSTIRVDDALLVEPGEVVPVDATLQDEDTEFDESSLTGESLPVTYHRGDTLLSGAINGGTAVRIVATKAAKDSQYQQILKLVESAANNQAPFVRLADRYAVPFTIVSFAIAGVAWGLSGDPVRFAEVLVVATPCPLLLAAPIALISGMSRAARHGIIMKSGAILERLATIRSVAFDKTGTLTRGEPTVTDVIAQKGFSSKEVLGLAASAEQYSAHILARSLVAEGERQHITLQDSKNLREKTAHGVEAVINKQTVRVGKADFLREAGVKVKAALLSAGEMAVYVAVDDRYAGAVIFRDEIRKESKRVVSTLRNMGVRTIAMITGDATTTAKHIGKEVGITQIHAECLPADKVATMNALRPKPTMMVGDGVNDAPVLAAADVGMAMGARGSTAASETADVVVLVDDVSKSVQAIQIAKYTLRIALQSVWIGIAISVGLMVVAASGKIPALTGALLQEAVDVIVILNALRAHGQFGRR